MLHVFFLRNSFKNLVTYLVNRTCFCNLLIHSIFVLEIKTLKRYLSQAFMSQVNEQGLT